MTPIHECPECGAHLCCLKCKEPVNIGRVLGKKRTKKKAKSSARNGTLTKSSLTGRTAMNSKLHADATNRPGSGRFSAAPG